MKLVKFNYIFLIFVFILSVTSGCRTPKYITPDIPDWSAGVIKTDDYVYVRIAFIDGKKATGTLQGLPADELPDSVIVSPGYHSITPCYVTPNGVSYGDILQFYTQEEQAYVVRHKIKWDKTIKFWVEHKGIDITTEY